MKTTWKIAVLLVAVALIFVGYTSFKTITGRAVQPGKYDAFAQCLTEKGAVEYGAYWCSNCETQKKLFGSSFQFVNYVECDPLGKNAQPELCKEKSIRGYPTWIIDGEKYEGALTLGKLSELTGCNLTQ